MEAVTLQGSGGLNVMRLKGGANPNTLKTLTNGYVTAAGTIRMRPAAIYQATLPTDCRGLVAFQGALQSFCARYVGVIGIVTVNTLRHPDPSQSALTLTDIHFAAPFLGFLYVVAEFSNGDVFHYWLQPATTWQANTVYLLNAGVQPTAPAGLTFQATYAGPAIQSWAPNVARALGDIVIPTVPNGFKYQVTQVIGTAPASGTVEPVWPTVPGATVMEDTSLGTQPTASSGAATPPQTLPPGVATRYGTGLYG